MQRKERYPFFNTNKNSKKNVMVVGTCGAIFAKLRNYWMGRSLNANELLMNQSKWQYPRIVQWDNDRVSSNYPGSLDISLIA